jgi:hypothetical protein
MDKYLQQILQGINTIIIPGLGALTVTNKTTGELMFMTFLKHDDGNLSKIIAERKEIPENEAKNLIAKYVRDILSKLDAGESYDMFQFGSFKKINGEIVFENWNPNNQQQNSNDVEEKINISEKNEIESKENVNVEEIKEEKNDQLILEKQENTNQQTLDEIINKESGNKESGNKDSSNKESDKSEILDLETPSFNINNTEIEKKDEEIEKKVTSIDVSEIKPNENIYIPVEEVKEIELKQAEKLEEEKVEKQNNSTQNNSNSKTNFTHQKSDNLIKIKEKKKKSPLFWLGIIVLFVLVIGGTGAYIFKEKLQEILNNATIKYSKVEQVNLSEEDQEAMEKLVELENEENPEVLENSIEKSSKKSIIEESKTQNKTLKTTPNSNESKAFHIIVGGFTVENNANRFAKKFQDEGKSAEVLGKFDDKFLVSYESFNTKTEAQQALKNMSIEGWVFYYLKN